MVSTQSQHSYDLPEIIAVPMVKTTERYGNWVREQIL
ncbi:MAG: divalent cation tolerance protein CutA [Cyanobacteria bacterium P01_H01_bin.105]